MSELSEKCACIASADPLHLSLSSDPKSLSLFLSSRSQSLTTTLVPSLHEVVAAAVAVFVVGEVTRSSSEDFASVISVVSNSSTRDSTAPFIDFYVPCIAPY